MVMAFMQQTEFSSTTNLLAVEKHLLPVKLLVGSQIWLKDLKNVSIWVILMRSVTGAMQKIMYACSG